MSQILEILHDDKLPQCEQISMAMTKLGELRENEQASASNQLYRNHVARINHSTVG